jgi:hypothetical protein
MLYNLRHWVFQRVRTRFIGLHKNTTRRLLSILLSDVIIISIHFSDTYYNINTNTNKTHQILLLTFDDNGIIIDIPTLY